MIKNNRLRVREEQIEIHQVPLENGHDWVVLKGTGKARIGKYEHETVKGHLYVGLQALADDWFNELPLGNGQLVTDVTMVFRGIPVHLEVDLGNMESERLFNKIDRYAQYAGQGEKVIFVLRDGRYKAGVTGTAIIDYCTERRLGNFVTATLFDNFLEFPLGDVLISPKDGRVSLEQIIG
jgi:hypothetical protein